MNALVEQTERRLLTPPTRRSVGVDSFYHLRSGELAPDACCCGTACFVARQTASRKVQKPDERGSRIYCLGKCFAAPSRVCDAGWPVMSVRSSEAIVLPRLAQGGAPTLESYRKLGGYQSLEQALHRTPEAIVEEVERSELRGRGGAGFPTGKKWRAAFKSAGTKYVVANADEGDPGAYVDRFLLEGDPHALIEGMAIAGWAVGASNGWIYLRKEYPVAEKVLKSALAEAREANWIGQRIQCTKFDFDIELVVGEGSYVCGEETALLNAIEGRRPEVRVRPPYPTEHGLFGRPTIVNNVETLVNIPWIVAHGGERYRSLGFPNSRGTKVVSLNSLFNRPGLYEIEFGISVREIVEDIGGGLRSGHLQGVIIGGPLAGIIPSHLLDTRFAFDELRAIGASVGHGGIIAFDYHTSIVALMHHVFEFAAYESCGKCTPCRVGSERVRMFLHDVLNNGAANHWDKVTCEQIIHALRDTCLCGLGSGLAEFAESCLRYFGKELELCCR